MFRSSLGYSLASRVIANKSLYRWMKPIADKYADIAGYKQVCLGLLVLLTGEGESNEL